MALTFLQSANSTADTNAYTFSAQNLGTASADRYIIVSAFGRKAGASTTISSITIGGVSATIVKQVTNNVTNTDVAGLAIAAVPTGATGDVVVTFGASMVRAAIGLWSATGLVSATPTDTGSSTANAPTYDLDVNANGFAIGAGATAANTTASWTELTEDFDAVVESALCYSGASKAYATTQTNKTMTVTFGSVEESAGVFASWELLNSYTMSCNVGAFTLTGNDVNLTKGYIMQVATGVFNLVGNAVNMVIHGIQWFNSSKSNTSWTSQEKNDTTWTNINKT